MFEKLFVEVLFKKESLGELAIMDWPLDFDTVSLPLSNCSINNRAKVLQKYPSVDNKMQLIMVSLTPINGLYYGYSPILGYVVSFSEEMIDSMINLDKPVEPAVSLIMRQIQSGLSEVWCSSDETTVSKHINDVLAYIDSIRNLYPALQLQHIEEVVGSRLTVQTYHFGQCGKSIYPEFDVDKDGFKVILSIDVPLINRAATTGEQPLDRLSLKENGYLHDMFKHVEAVEDALDEGERVLNDLIMETFSFEEKYTLIHDDFWNSAGVRFSWEIKIINIRMNIYDQYSTLRELGVIADAFDELTFALACNFEEKVGN